MFPVISFCKFRPLRHEASALRRVSPRRSRDCDTSASDRASVPQPPTPRPNYTAPSTLTPNCYLITQQLFSNWSLKTTKELLTMYLYFIIILILVPVQQKLNQEQSKFTSNVIQVATDLIIKQKKQNVQLSII